MLICLNSVRCVITCHNLNVCLTSESLLYDVFVYGMFIKICLKLQFEGVEYPFFPLKGTCPWRPLIPYHLIFRAL